MTYLQRTENPSYSESKEKKMLTEVCTKYGLIYESSKKVRSAYKIKTNKGIVLLKRTKHGIKKIYNANMLVDEFYKVGFINTPKYYKTVDDKLHVRYKNYIFCMTEWIDGTECEMGNISEVINCCRLLSLFHFSASKINVKKLDLTNSTKNLPQIFSKCIRDFSIFKRIIDNKRIKTEFDIYYEKSINDFYEKGLISLKILGEYLNSFSSKNNLKHCVCHNSFYYQNILKAKDKYYIVDLDSILFDLRITDLGKFIRRLMYKNEYDWDFEKAKIMIESYEYKDKLTVDELIVLLSLIIFPHKFWKLGQKRYIKSKNWNEKKYNHKLKKIVSYNEKIENFINKYVDYIEKRETVKQ